MIERIYLYLIHTILLYFYKKAYKLHVKSNVEQIQNNKLLEILEKNKNSFYGKKYKFDKIKNIDDFQKNIPFTIYENYIPYIDRIKNGEKNVLTSEKITMFELTSGSSSASKLIPYTDGLKKEFQNGIKTWLYLLYTKYPKLKYGRSYWSITPVTETENKKIIIPVGFEEDSEYFGKFEKYLMELLFVNPKDVKKEKNIDVFYLKTVTEILNCKNLRLISIWSPSFLILLLDYIESNKEKVLEKVNPKRRKEIQNYIYSKEYFKIWKHLKIISCWGDNNSSKYLEKIQKLFPKTVIQEKGLLATECFVSFPDTTFYGNCLSYHSHFFEFINMEDNKIYTASNLKQNSRYEVVVTTSGGFYRYKLGDIVEVTHIQNGLPYIKFIGRKGLVSDLFGEKLNEIFLRDVMKSLNIDFLFCMFAPKTDHYVLYILTEDNLLADEIDKKLRTNFHYDYCRKLGQLKMLKIFKLTENCEKEYINYCQKKGQKLGNIKLKILSKENEWDKIFTGFYK